MQQMTKAKIVIGVLAAGSVVQTVASMWALNKTLKAYDRRGAFIDRLLASVIKNVPAEYLEGLEQDMEFEAAVATLRREGMG